MNREDWAIAQRGETLRLSKSYGQAIEIFEQLQEKYPDNAWVNAHLGAIYCQLMDYGQAKDCLKKAIEQDNNYSWAHAQLGETYRLLAITENQEARNTNIDSAIEHFKTALDGEAPEDSSYAWALAHLGATYRLKITNGISEVLRNPISVQSSEETNGLKENKEKALECLNRAIELIPTYAWAWGMRATVYRLAQEYEASFWDLGVLTVIAPEIEVLQHSSSPVSFLTSRWVNLHEHAFLAFYLTKKEEDLEEKQRQYSRAIAYAQQALQVQPGDLIAQLILLVIEANQKKEMQDGSLKDPGDINKIEKSSEQFFQYAESALFETIEKVLRHLIALKRINREKIETIRATAGEKHPLTKLILEEVIEESEDNKSNTPQLWLWKNFALTQTSSSVLWLLSDLSEILPEESVIGKAEPYRELAGIINPSYAIERLYQTPVLAEKKRLEIFNSLSPVIAL